MNCYASRWCLTCMQSRLVCHRLRGVPCRHTQAASDVLDPVYSSPRVVKLGTCTICKQLCLAIRQKSTSDSTCAPFLPKENFCISPRLSQLRLPQRENARGTCSCSVVRRLHCFTWSSLAMATQVPSIGITTIRADGYLVLLIQYNVVNTCFSPYRSWPFV
jgi:hypothetical protein